MNDAPTIRQIPARDIQTGDVIIFENFVRGHWVTVERTVTSTEHLITLDWRRIVNIHLEGNDTPLEYASRAPLTIR